MGELYFWGRRGGIDLEVKGKVFTHMEQHFAPLDNILEGLKAEKHSSVWADQGLKERAVLTAKIWETAAKNSTGKKWTN